MPEVIEDWASRRGRITFVRIGSHDGSSVNDPLSHLIDVAPEKWNGIMVEPVPALFWELESLRGENPDLRLVGSDQT